MPRALPCPTCGNDHSLRFRLRTDVDEDGNYGAGADHWINCEGCGMIGPVRRSPSEAGNAWNEERAKENHPSTQYPIVERLRPPTTE